MLLCHSQATVLRYISEGEFSCMIDYKESINQILDIEAENILKLKNRLNPDVVYQVISRLAAVKPKGRKVITAGCGTSGMLARRVAHTLSVVEIPSFFCSPADAVHGGSGCIQRDDTVILFSKGGNTPEILSYLPICRAKGSYTIGVSQNDASALARKSDLYFKIEIDKEADTWNLCASASCNAIAAVWDAIAFTTAQYTGFTKEDLALIHPGGLVGERLKST